MHTLKDRSEQEQIFKEAIFFRNIESYKETEDEMFENLEELLKVRTVKVSLKQKSIIKTVHDAIVSGIKKTVPQKKSDLRLNRETFDG